MSNIRYDRYKQTYIDIDTGEKFPVIWVEQLIEDWDITRCKMQYNFWKYCFTRRYAYLEYSNEQHPIQPAFHGAILIRKDTQAPYLSSNLTDDEKFYESDRLLDDNINVLDILLDYHIISEDWDYKKYGLPDGSKCTYAEQLINKIRQNEQYEPIIIDDNSPYIHTLYKL